VISLISYQQELLGNDGVFLYPTFTDCATYHLEGYYKIFNITYTIIMNALEVPVTNCPVDMNKHGLPIGIQVLFLKFPSHSLTLLSGSRESRSSA